MTVREALRVLEIEGNPTGEQALKAYKDLVRVWHPDNFSTKPELLDRATAKTKQLNEAWTVIEEFALTGSGVRGQAEGPRPRARRPRTGPLVLTALVLLSCLLLVSLALLAGASDLFNPALKLEKDLTERSFQMNKGLPVDLDSETRLTATYAGPGKRFTYLYQIRNYSKDEVGPSYFDGVRKALKDGFFTTRGQDRSLEFFGAHDVVLAYSFKDKNGADVATLVFGPMDYLTP